MLKLFLVPFVALSLFVTSGLSAQAGPFILVDLNSEKVLAADRPTDPWYPASITKLMTLYVAVEAIRNGELSLTSTLKMSRNASRAQPSKMGFKVGTQVTMANAFQMLIVKSANDIAVAIAERVSGSVPAFAKRMTATARRIGMTGSNFVNPHGLPNKSQYVTARDMAVLAAAFHRNFPEVMPIFKLAAIRFGKSNLRSHNLLVEHYRGATGMKTGFICSGGLTMVGSAKRGSKNLLVVILGELSSIDRAEKAALVLERGFGGSFSKSRGALASYKPRPTRSSPVDIRPHVCGGHRKIRQFQIVAPQPRPKKGIFKRSKYTSPQRKNFGPNLGDKSHPQGALIGVPGRRKSRSHILQPRREGAISRVYAGPHRPDVKVPFTVNVSKKARKQLAKVQKQEALRAEANATPAFGIPLPRQNPLVAGRQSRATPVTTPAAPTDLRPAVRSSASAFANASNGAAAVKPASAASSLHQ
ncbi:MAG: D-alanyl-D-alanine carboxypeptidase family protein [Hyphomicrobiales bacterium]